VKARQPQPTGGRNAPRQVPEDKRAELYEGHQAYLADKAARDAEKEKRREAEKAEKAERAAKRKKDDDASDDEASERHKVLIQIFVRASFGALILVQQRILRRTMDCAEGVGCLRGRTVAAEPISW
jgi:FtsZ-interacting cell division protein ZipA